MFQRAAYLNTTKKIIQVAILGLGLTAITTAAAAAPQSSPSAMAIQGALCLTPQNNVPAEMRISACTAVIDSGTFPEAGIWSLYFSRGRTYGSIGRHAEALTDLSRSIELDPTHGEVFLTRGISYQILQQHALAVSDINEMIRLFPDHSNPLYRLALYTRGISQLNLREFDRAFEDFNGVLDIDPNFGGAYSGRAAVFIARADIDSAMADADRAIEINPQDAMARFTRGSVFVTRQEFQRAEGDLSVVISTTPENPAAYEWRARARSNLHNFAGALEDYNTASRLAPTNVGYLNSRCWFGGIVATDLDAALAACEEAVEQDPSAAYIDSRGFVRLRRGEYSDAIVDYTIAISLNPEQSESHFGRGIAHIRSGRRAEGEADIAAALELNPDVEADFARYGVTR